MQHEATIKALNMQNYTSAFYFVTTVVLTQCCNLTALTARASMDNIGSFQLHRGTQKFSPWILPQMTPACLAGTLKLPQIPAVAVLQYFQIFYA
jgi:hypothetical protein